MKTMKYYIIISYTLLLFNPIKILAQQINLDKIVKAGELTLFQELNDEKVYYYVLDKPSIATDENGIPKFSFLRYVDNVRSGATEAEAREGEGGGIVHALVELSVTGEQLDEAKKELKKIVPGAIIKGPVLYNEGTISLISSFAKADGELSKQVIGIGKAPLLDGERAAISVQLTKQGAKILWESFKTPTPDMSVSFEMSLTGFRSPKRAVIEADFEQIYKHQNFQAGIASSYLAAEIKASFEDLTKKGSIKVTQTGEDANLEKIMELAYGKILNMMFEPAGGTGTPSLNSLTPQGNSTGVLDRATNLLNTSRADARRENERIRSENQAARDRAAATEPATNTETATEGETNSETVASRPNTLGAAAHEPRGTSSHGRNANPTDTPSSDTEEQEEESVPSFAIALSYEMKEIHQRGIFNIDLNKYTTDDITLRFDKNFGEIKCDKCFRQVNLDDPLYKQRELVAFVDGANSQDFGEFINFVDLAMKKTHQGGDVTNDEVRIDRNNFNKEGNNFKLLYGWKGDNDRSKWMDYEYKTTWSFFGGNTIQSGWQKSSTGAVALAPPYLQRKINLEADPDVIKSKGVRSIDVILYYKLGDKEQSKNITLLASKQEFSKQVSIIMPKDNTIFDYEITWTLTGNKTKKLPRSTSNSSVIFVDEIPEN